MPALRRRPGPCPDPAPPRSGSLTGRAGGAVTLAAAAVAVFVAAAVLPPPGGARARAEEAVGGPPAVRAGVHPCVRLPGPSRFWLHYYPGERFWAGGGVPAQAWVAWTAWGCRRVPLPPLWPPGGREGGAAAVSAMPSEVTGASLQPLDAPAAPPEAPPEPREPERPADQPADRPDDSPAAQLLRLANGDRRRAGLHALAADPDLDRLAARKAADMVRLAYFSHQSPTYGSPFDMLAEAGIGFRSAAENLARAADPAGAHTALMDSAGHRGNLLSRSFTHVGMGTAAGPRGTVFVQLFVER